MGDIFDEVGSAQASAGGNYIKPGRGRLAVLKIGVENKRRGPCLIAEFKVVTSTQTDPARPPNPVGTTCSQVIPLKDPNLPSGPGNAKALVLALAGKTEAEMPADQYAKLMRQVCGAENPARGRLIDYETRDAVSRKGTPLVLVNWTHVPRGTDEAPGENHPTKVEARKAAL